YRPVGGYGQLFEYLLTEILTHRATIHLESRVCSIEWARGEVRVLTAREEFSADNVIVTSSLGNLQTNAIQFSPGIDHSGFPKIGFGEVIKFAMEFESAFWEETHPDLGFLFTDDGFTFWTQLQMRKPMLVGWIGNDHTPEYAKWSDEKIISVAISHLQKAFPKPDIAKSLRKSIVFKYDRSSPSGGGYSWTTPESKRAILEINKGIEDTIWFAGEAFQSKGDVGTVEAAFQSGRYIARKVFKNFTRK
ncbi:MAG: hypothetical protein EOP06_09865, partial [Proteobacteria bacterium]